MVCRKEEASPEEEATLNTCTKQDSAGRKGEFSTLTDEEETQLR